jgi:hypothetical protein
MNEQKKIRIVILGGASPDYTQPCTWTALWLVIQILRSPW